MLASIIVLFVAQGASPQNLVPDTYRTSEPVEDAAAPTSDEGVSKTTKAAPSLDDIMRDARQSRPPLPVASEPVPPHSDDALKHILSNARNSSQPATRRIGHDVYSTPTLADERARTAYLPEAVPRLPKDGLSDRIRRWWRDAFGNGGTLPHLASMALACGILYLIGFSARRAAKQRMILLVAGSLAILLELFATKRIHKRREL